MRTHATGRANRAIALTLVGILTLTAIAPLVGASHMTLLYNRNPLTGQPVEEELGRVFEDDGQVASHSHESLDGLTNKVRTNVTDGIGDGSALLDTMYYWGENPGFIATTSIFQENLGKKMIAPGVGTFMTFFGWWQDLDGDGMIDEFSDLGDSNPLDEFKWRGVGSRDASWVMPFFTIPRSTTGQGTSPDDVRCGPTTGGWTVPGVVTLNCVSGAGFAAWYNESSSAANGEFVDRTSTNDYPDQQMWVLGGGWGSTFYEDSLIMSVQTITAAAQERATTGNQIINLANAKFVDVDSYESLNPDVESMWVTTMRGVRDGVYDDTRRTFNENGAAADRDANAAADDALNTTFDLVDPFVGTILDAVFGIETVNATYNFAIATANGGVASGVDTALGVPRNAVKIIAPNVAKEPNHPLDNFGGRAVYGGVGDYRGSGNTYPGYEDQWGFWFDARAEMHVENTANVDVRPASTTVGVFGVLARTGIEPTPGGSVNEGDRNSGVKMNFFAHTVAWNDLNKDHWLGAWCDPEAEGAWDAENDRCANDPHYQFVNELDGNPQMRSPASFGGLNGEIIGVCGATSAKGGTIKLEPVGGPWPPGTIVFRQTSSVTSAIWDNGNIAFATGTTPIILNFDGGGQCGSSGTGLRAVDAVYFPGGNPGVGILTTTTATLGKLVDTEKGVDILNHSVTDVDFYAPSL